MTREHWRRIRTDLFILVGLLVGFVTINAIPNLFFNLIGI